MGRWSFAETAAGQASVLFVASGSLGLLSTLIPGGAISSGLQFVYAGSIASGLAIYLLPWHRWTPRATLVCMPAAFTLIVLGRWLDPGGVVSLYALWFAVAFGWVGTWHPARTSLIVAPIAAIAYVIPFLPGSPTADPKSLASVVIAIPIAIVLAEVLAAKTAAMGRARGALEDAAVVLERANLTDDLTGLGNRRRANALLEAMAPGDALVLLDLDGFKAVNDTRGHAEGDRILVELGRFLLDSVRDADCVARFGGEEFLILMRGAGNDAKAVVERLLAGWRTSACGVTLSAGAAVHAAGSLPAVTLKRADGLLYEAKHAGRDRLVIESPDGPTQPSEMIVA